MAYNLGTIHEVQEADVDKTMFLDLGKMPVNRNGVLGRAKTGLSEQVKKELDSRRLKPVSELKIAKGPARNYYVEWWEVGDAETAIQAGEIQTRDIKHVLRLMIFNGKRSITYLKNDKDKVLWDRR